MIGEAIILKILKELGEPSKAEFAIRRIGDSKCRYVFEYYEIATAPMRRRKIDFEKKRRRDRTVMRRSENGIATCNQPIVINENKSSTRTNNVDNDLYRVAVTTKLNA